MPDFDVCGVGENATDTVLLLPKFPPYGGKVPFARELTITGGQVASAIVACARLGLKSKYIGSIGDDTRGQLQIDSLVKEGIDVSDVLVRKSCNSQTSYIVIDQGTGERTIMWSRPECLRLTTAEITPEKIQSARLLHIDGHDTPAVAKAAQIARQAGIPVTLDVDTVHHGFDQVLAHTDYMIASSEFPIQWTSERDPFKALEIIQHEFGMKVAAMTLGAHGAMARVNGKFHYSPAFIVNTVDTTGAGDVFHGAFCYAVLNQMSIMDALDLSNAMAALNCTAVGARGGIKSLAEAKALMSRAERRSNREYELAVTIYT